MSAIAFLAGGCVALLAVCVFHRTWDATLFGLICGTSWMIYRERGK